MIASPERECPCVLVADDDPTVRVLVSTTLHASGYDVIGAATGREAAGILDGVTLRFSGIDLVLADVRMPGLGGFALLEHLCSAHRRVPVVLMTAFPDPHLRARAASYDVPLLEKPFTLERLRKTVRDELLRIHPTCPATSVSV
jgi:CheY-like chemotaxis protein